LYFISTTFILSQNSIDKVLRKYRNDEGVAHFNFAGNIHRILEQNADIKTKIDACDVIVFSNKENIATSDLTKLKAAIASDKMEEYMNIKDKRGKFTLYVKSSKTDAYSKVFSIVQYEDKTIYFTLDGSIYINELTKLNMDFIGTDALNKFLK
jgi:hypothetical protein